MNWLSKIDDLIVTMKDAAISHWEVATVLGMSLVVVCAVIAALDPDRRAAMRSKMRIFRYCHNCPYVDLPTETCSIDGTDNERCGLIDTQAGMSFTVTKD